MISASSSYGLGILQQTSLGLLQGRSQPLSIQSLASLSSPTTGYGSTVSNGGNSDMISQMASEKESADSAELLLQEVYQRLRTAREDVASGSTQNASNLATLADDLVTTQTSLTELKLEAQSSSSSRRLFTIVQQAVSDAIGSVSQASKLSTNLGANVLQQGERRVLAAITRTNNLSQNLEQASLNIVKVQRAYSGFDGLSLSGQSNWLSIDDINVSGAQQFSGRLLDIVS